MQDIWDTEKEFSEVWGYKLKSTDWLDIEVFKFIGMTEWVAGQDRAKTLRNNAKREQKM